MSIPPITFNDGDVSVEDALDEAGVLQLEKNHAMGRHQNNSRWINFFNPPLVGFLNGPIPASFFLYFRLFNTADSK